MKREFFEKEIVTNTLSFQFTERDKNEYYSLFSGVPVFIDDTIENDYELIFD